MGLLFYDPVCKVVAASHAGWRGTVNEIGKKTVSLMSSSFGCNPKNIRVGISPSIGPCCFEVDKPVYDEFLKINSFNALPFIQKKINGKYNIDLWKINRESLILSGVNPANISVSDLCTKCLHDDFFSHRHTAGKRGNLAAMIALK